MKRIVCIGSRQVDQGDASYLQSIGRRTVSNGDLLVSGNAPGSDQAYALGGNMVDAGLVELCLPWATFEKKWIVENPDYTHSDWRSREMVSGNRIRLASEAHYNHLKLANAAHPGFSHLSQGAQKLLVRNAMMLLDDAEILSDLVIAWPDRTSHGWGGTGHTMQVAWALQVPVWLANAGCWWNGEMN